MKNSQDNNHFWDAKMFVCVYYYLCEWMLNDKKEQGCQIKGPRSDVSICYVTPLLSLVSMFNIGLLLNISGMLCLRSLSFCKVGHVPGSKILDGPGKTFLSNPILRLGCLFDRNFVLRPTKDDACLAKSQHVCLNKFKYKEGNFCSKTCSLFQQIKLVI